jgi:hypothetical protein
MAGNRFVIRGHHPVRNIVLVVVSVAVAAAGCALAYWQGGRGSSTQLGTLMRVGQEQRAQVEALERANRGLREQLSRAERVAQVDHAAAKLTRDSLSDHTSELMELRQAVALYRAVLGEDNEGNRLRVFGARLLGTVRTNSGGQRIRVEIVLTRFLNAASALEGDVTVTLLGTTEGVDDVRVQLGAVASKFRLKHIQRVQLDLPAPDDFVPAQLLVQVAAKHKQQTIRTQRTLSWDELDLR